MEVNYKKWILTQCTESQKIAHMILESGKNGFITGPPGSGKSFLVKSLRHYGIWGLNKIVKVVSSTASSAELVDANTLHSISGLGVGDQGFEQYLKRVEQSIELKSFYLRTDVLIIDEVSLMTGIFMSLFDHMAQYIRQCPLPFGGIQILAIGDFSQLTVEQGKENTETKGYLFQHDVWKRLDYDFLSLKENIRQSEDENFYNVLTKIRRGQYKHKMVLDFIIRCSKMKEIKGKPIVLMAKRDDVDRFNMNKFNELLGERRTYIADGDHSLSKTLPVSVSLTLCEGISTYESRTHQLILKELKFF